MLISINMTHNDSQRSSNSEPVSAQGMSWGQKSDKPLTKSNDQPVHLCVYTSPSLNV